MKKQKNTLIDQICYNKTFFCIGNLLCPLTDHLPIFLILNLQMDRNHNDIIRRDYSSYNKNEMIAEINNNHVFENINTKHNVNDKYNFFRNSLSTLIEKHIPLE